MAGKPATTHVEHEPAVSAVAVDADSIGIDDHVLLKMADAIPDFAEVNENAQQATDFEHNMTLAEALKLYPKAILFSFILSLAIVSQFLGFFSSIDGCFFQKRLRNSPSIALLILSCLFRACR